jgi:hypothetical protein
MHTGVRVFLLIVISSVTGFWGFVITFSDSPEHWSMARWIAYIVAWHLPGAVLIGGLFPDRWLLSLLVGWGAATVLVFVMAPYVLTVLLTSIAAAGYAGKLISAAIMRVRSET